LSRTTNWPVPLSAAAWHHHIGGYHVVQRWLKQRRSIGLTRADIEQGQRIIDAVEETDRVMEEIDPLLDLR